VFRGAFPPKDIQAMGTFGGVVRRCEAIRRRVSIITNPWSCHPSVMVLSLSKRASRHSPPLVDQERPTQLECLC
jgi:hypothetical protein